MKVSFDWDNTIVKVPSDFNQIFDFAKSLIQMAKITGIMKVVVFTTKPTRLFDASFISVLEELGLTKEDVISTEGEWKFNSIDHHGIDLHFDDWPEEVVWINERCKAKAVLVNGKADFMSLFDDKNF